MKRNQNTEEIDESYHYQPYAKGEKPCTFMCYASPSFKETNTNYIGEAHPCFCEQALICFFGTKKQNQIKSIKKNCMS